MDIWLQYAYVVGLLLLHARTHTHTHTHMFSNIWIQTCQYSTSSNFNQHLYFHHHHHHHHIPEGLGSFPVPWSSRWSWPFHLFLVRPMFLRPFGLCCSDCLVFCLCPSSVRVVAIFSGTVLFPWLCSVLPFFPPKHWFFTFILYT